MQINEMPVVRNTVKDKIIILDKDVTDQLLIDLKNAEKCFQFFCMSLDFIFVRLEVIVRFLSGNAMKENLIKLMTLSEKIRGQDVLNELKKEFIQQGFNYSIVYCM